MRSTREATGDHKVVILLFVGVGEVDGAEIWKRSQSHPCSIRRFRAILMCDGFMMFFFLVFHE